MAVVINDGETRPASGGGRLIADAAHASERSHARLTGLLTDFFLPDAHRASDQARAVMARLFDQLVGEVEGDLRAVLTPQFETGAPDVATALASERVAIALPVLRSTGLLRDGELIGLLLARAEEHRIVQGLRRIAEAGLDPVDPPPAPEDPVAIVADRALRIAENGRVDAAHEPLLAAADLPTDMLHRVVWRVAAALRDYLVRLQCVDPAQADQHVSAAGAALIAAHDEDGRLEAVAVRLAQHWRVLGIDDDVRLHHALRQGRFALFAAMLATRGGIDPDVAAAMAADGDVAQLAVLLRATEVGRDTAVMILFEMAAIHGLDEQRLMDTADDFSRLDPAAARQAIAPSPLDRGYRSAVAELAAGTVAP